MSFFENKEISKLISAKRKGELEQIFSEILNDNSYLMSLASIKHMDVNLFKKSLRQYRKALLKELKHLPTSYDHPIRAAYALRKLNTPEYSNEFAQNLDSFIAEAENSKFYPETKIKALVLSPFLLGAALVAASLILLVCLGPLPLLNAVAISIVLGLMSGVIALAAYAVCNALYEENKNAFHSVSESKTAGNKIALFFQSGLPPKESQQEDDMEEMDSEASLYAANS